MSENNFAGIPQGVEEGSEKPPIQMRTLVPALKCENCGKEHDGSYGSGRFCSKSCKASFNAKKVKWNAERLAKLAEARSHIKYKETEGGHCRFCQKLCKNGNSLRNHERLCKENPNRQTPTSNWHLAMKKRGGNVQSPQEYSCQFCGKVWITTKSGFHTHESFCSANPERKECYWKGKHLSEIAKQKISEGTKKAHDEGRGHTWQNRYLNPSYAEQWLYGFLDSRNIQYEKEVPFKGFFLDVVVGNKVIEIDGEQHYDEKKFPQQIESDKRKDKLLKENGFEELRLRWSLVQKDKENQIKILESFLK